MYNVCMPYDGQGGACRRIPRPCVTDDPGTTGRALGEPAAAVRKIRPDTRFFRGDDLISREKITGATGLLSAFPISSNTASDTPR